MSKSHIVLNSPAWQNAIGNFSVSRIGGVTISLPLPNKTVFKAFVTRDADKLAEIKLAAQVKAAVIINREKAVLSTIAKNANETVLQLGKYIETTKKDIETSKVGGTFLNQTIKSHQQLGLPTKELLDNAKSLIETVRKQEALLAKLESQRDAAASKLAILGSDDYEAKTALIAPEVRKGLHTEAISAKDLAAANKELHSLSNLTFVGREVGAFLNTEVD